MVEAGIIVILVVVNLILVATAVYQRFILTRAQKFLNDFIDNSEDLVGAVEKCIGIINKNAELLLETSTKTNNLEEDVVRLKAIYALTKDYFGAIETINEARRLEMSVSQRVYQIQHKEDAECAVCK